MGGNTLDICRGPTCTGIHRPPAHARAVGLDAEQWLVLYTCSGGRHAHFLRML